MNLMKFKKTHKNDRQTYKYRFSRMGDDGRYIDEVVELKAGENGVTEMDILKLHRRDDLDSYYYYKSIRPERTPEEKAKVEAWKAAFVADFEKEHGYTPDPDYVQGEADDYFPRNYVISLDQVDDDFNPEKNPLQLLLCKASEQAVQVDPRVDRLLELMLNLTPEQQQLIHQVLYEGKSQVEIAEELGVTKQAIQNRLNKIYARLRKLF